MNAPCTTILAACASLLLGSCALLQQPSEVTTFAPFLTPIGQIEHGASEARAWRLTVDRPLAIAPFDGTRIAVAPAPGEIQFYKGARWRDSVPVLLQDLLLQAFDDAPEHVRATAVVNGGRVDFVLHSNLRTFMAEYHHARFPVVNVQLAVQLVRRSDSEIVAAHTFAVQEDCKSTQMPAVFSAFQDATNQIVREVVAWTVSAADAGAVK